MRRFETVEEIMNELEKGQYGYYGFRSLSEHDLEIIESGRNYLDVSHVWEDGEDSGEELTGTCAISINEYMNESEITRRYERCRKTYRKLIPHESVIALIADNMSEYGEDENEIILGSNGCGADIIGYVSFV